MQEQNQPQTLPRDVFGMTQEDIKNYRIKSFWGKIRYYLAAIGPTIVRLLNAVIYYTLKFIKAFVKNVFQMIFKGGGS